MNIQEIAERMEKLDNWSLEGNSITKTFEFENFKLSLEFVNKVGEIAEEMNHHPDILINYNRVKLVLITHHAKEITEKDFDVAGKIDLIEKKV
ncbi:4a-hydroxytetrahydrobiopterin dehydratase [Candidatus Pacearchaeota archaeon CG10_big_fil_rev_8_21_14_0_10_34_76]|nr:MAG: 4a-hydroxytetrahydrobiopterin dehydratase [Candidatus Pacearchaeota archaeon CG10_big_fil_rev_8_21_14_0_10_34_76]